MSISAEIYSLDGVLIGAAGPDQVNVYRAVICRDCPISAKLIGHNKRGRDVLRVLAPRIAHGAQVVLERQVGGQWAQVGRQKRLGPDGKRGFSVPDLNGRAVTKYRALLSPARDLVGDITAVVRLR